jgi:hypothetical protein
VWRSQQNIAAALNLVDIQLGELGVKLTAVNRVKANEVGGACSKYKHTETPQDVPENLSHASSRLTYHIQNIDI